MQTKLTLRLDDSLIRSAKEFAGKQGKSVSQLVAEYFTLLVTPASEESLESSRHGDLSPVTRSLLGILKEAELTPDEYHGYLVRKYR